MVLLKKNMYTKYPNPIVAISIIHLSQWDILLIATFPPNVTTNTITKTTEVKTIISLKTMLTDASPKCFVKNQVSTIAITKEHNKTPPAIPFIP